MQIAQRAERITPFLVMEILEEAQRLEHAGQRIIHLEVGEPDFSTPQCAVDAAVEGLRGGETHYTSSLGILELREAICADYLSKHGVSVKPEQIIVSQGTSPALFSVFGVLLEPGDEVIIANPAYACYPNFISFVGGVPVSVDVFEHEGYQLRPEAIAARITPRTKAILINTVANPTGTVLDGERMAAIAELGPLVVSDEIYHGLVYEGKEHSILEYTDQAVALNGFSKLYAMTGWRVGYTIAPPQIIRAMQKLQQNFFISANAFVQRGALAALQNAAGSGEVERMRQTYAERRLYMLERLKGLGLEIPCPPTGAFYMLVNFRRYTSDSLAFAYELLREAGVAAAPGVDFGSNAEGYLRFSYATSKDNIAEGMDRLERFLQSRRN